MEKLKLPEQYIYKSIKIGQDRAIFRISGIVDKESAEEWIKEYEQRSETVWRVQRTYKPTERLYIFKSDFRCQHNVPHISKNMRESKNTGCPAVLKITVQRYFSLPKHKEPLPEVVEFPTLCVLLHSHNHLLNSAAIKRFKPLSEATHKRLIELFELGHTAATTRRMLQMEIVLQDNEDFEEVCMDNSKLPSLSVINHLLNKFRKVYASRKESDIKREDEEYISSYNQQPHCKADFSKETESILYGSRKESDIKREDEEYISSYNQQPHCKAIFSKETESIVYGSQKESDIEREDEEYISSYNQQPHCKATFSKETESIVCESQNESDIEREDEVYISSYNQQSHCKAAFLKETESIVCESQNESDIEREDEVYISSYNQQSHSKAAFSKETESIVYEKDDDILFQKLDDIFNRIKFVYKNNPDAFKPAIKNVVKTINKFGKTETGLLSVLHNFGRNLHYSSRTVKCRGRRGDQIPIQVKAISRRKFIDCGRKSHVGRRPVKQALLPALKKHAHRIFSESSSK